MVLLPSVTGSSCASCLLIHQRPQMEHSVDTGPNNPEQYHLSNDGRQDKCIAFFPTHSSPLFIPLLFRCLLFILMWSGWSSWWWHGVDYAVPTVTYSKAAEESTIVASDLWMTALPVAPAPHWRAHGEKGARRACVDVYRTWWGLTDLEGRYQYQGMCHESAGYQYFCASMKSSSIKVCDNPLQNPGIIRLF